MMRSGCRKLDKCGREMCFGLVHGNKIKALL
jgi:hypothetical protein